MKNKELLINCSNTFLQDKKATKKLKMIKTKKNFKSKDPSFLFAMIFIAKG